MPLSQLKNVNFGRTKLNATGSLGVGYQLLDVTGSIVSPRTTAGVYQTAPGIYAAYVPFPDNFKGQILWDTGTHYFLTASYAAEEYNGEANKIDQIYDIQFGRWRIVGNQMIFFKEDNSTEVARFNLFDDAGNPTMDAVFERIKV